jgi:hypothetical protein
MTQKLSTAFFSPSGVVMEEETEVHVPRFAPSTPLREIVKAFIAQHPGTVGTRAGYQGRIHGIARGFMDLPVGEVSQRLDLVREAIVAYEATHTITTQAMARNAWSGFVRYVKDTTGLDIPRESVETEAHRLRSEDQQRELRAERRAKLRLERNAPEIPIEVAVAVHKLQTLLRSVFPVLRKTITYAHIAASPAACFRPLDSGDFILQIPYCPVLQLPHDQAVALFQPMLRWSYPNAVKPDGPLVKNNPNGRKPASEDQLRYSLKTARQMGIDPDAPDVPKTAVPPPLPPPVPNPFDAP